MHSSTFFVDHELSDVISHATMGEWNVPLYLKHCLHVRAMWRDDFGKVSCNVSFNDLETIKFPSRLDFCGRLRMGA